MTRTTALVVAPFIPIASFMASHRGAQGVIYGDMIAQTGRDVTINFGGVVTDDFNQFDELYVYHGNDWQGSLNLYGGMENFPYAWNFRNMTKFKGPVYSLAIDFPDYHEMVTKKLEQTVTSGKKPLQEWYDSDLDNLKDMQQRAVTLKQPRLTGKIVTGDSHAICMYRPGWTVNSVPFKTLYGAMREGLDKYVAAPYLTGPDAAEVAVEEIELYFGNIDIRHHLCRQEDPIGSAKWIASDYYKAAESLYDSFPNAQFVSVYEPLPIETEERVIPKTGWYEGRPFWGTWRQRNDVRSAFIDTLDDLSKSGSVIFKRWTNYLVNSKGELDVKAMEYKKSVHLSRASYPYWTGRDYNTSLLPEGKQGLPAIEIRPTKSLESFFA